jgi:hypothetical protein
MKTRLLILGASLFATLVLSAQYLVAGPEPYTTSKEVAPPTITQSEPWHFTIAAPGWLAGMDGTIGVRRVNADIDITFPEILQHLDMIFAARAEAQKGPFGIFGEVFYIGLSDNAQINGLINNVHEQVDLTLVDGALSWRLINRPRGSLDLAAGTHYTNVYERLELNPDAVAIQQASERFVDDVAADLRERLDRDISQSEFISALKDSIRSVITSRIGDRLEDHERHPDIPIGPLGGRIRQEVAQVVERFIQAKEEALRDRIDALKLKGEARRAAVARAINAAKAQIANQLASTLTSKLDRNIARTDYWFDPYIGLRGQYNFNKTYYTAVRGEIGGFGVGFDLMWEVETVVGLNWTRSIFTEVGYRALGGNYQDNGFRFDVVMHGPQITTGITF